MPAAPPLPTAPPLTVAAADQWRAARIWRRLESRWLALLPVAVIILATATDSALPTSCDAPGSCEVLWPETAALVTLLAETLVLAFRPRGSALVPAVAAVLLWFLPGGLPNDLTRFTAVAAHAVLAAALFRVASGRRTARRQLEALMGPPVPYPWTLAPSPADGWPAPPPVPLPGSDESLVAVPFGPTPLPARPAPTGRRLLAALLLAAAVVLATVGLSRAADSDAHAAAATAVQATVLSADPDGLTAEVGYRLPDGTDQRTAELDIWWDYTPAKGDHLTLLADDQGWARPAGDPYDPTPWLAAAGVAATSGVLLLLSAADASRRRRALALPGAPALRVQVQPDSSGDQLVRPVGGSTTEPALWRVPARGGLRWGTADGGGPCWLPQGAVLDGEPPPAAELWGDATPEEAAEALERVRRPVEALLYQGPDGPYVQVLVFRPAWPGVDWLAQLAYGRAALPKLRRQGEGYLEDELAVPALAAQSLAETPVDAPSEPARTFSMPAPLRWTAGPLVALLLGTVWSTGSAGLYGGLVRPLLLGSVIFAASAGALSWELAVDRDGLWLAGALRRRRIPWDQVTAAAVHRTRLTVQLRGGGKLGVGGWPAALLSRHFGGPYAPQEVAATVTLLANRPELRPRAEPDGPPLGSPHLLLNRLALAGYLGYVLLGYFT